MRSQATNHESVPRCPCGGTPIDRTPTARDSLSSITVGLLGPVEATYGEATAPMASPRQSALLAALAVDAGRVVAVDLLVDRVWGEERPPQVRRTLHSYLSRLRRGLEQLTGESRERAVVSRKTGGYVLDVDPDQVDVRRFRRLVEQAGGAAPEDAARAQLLHEALGLWQGVPLAGLRGDWAERMRWTWQQQRIDATLDLAETRLMADPAAALRLVGEIAAENPLAERVVAIQIRALHGLGRTADALERFAVVRHRLAEDLGVDPGPQLRNVHQAVLRGDLPAASGARNAFWAR